MTTDPNDRSEPDVEDCVAIADEDTLRAYNKALTAAFPHLAVDIIALANQQQEQSE